MHHCGGWKHVYVFRCASARVCARTRVCVCVCVCVHDMLSFLCVCPCAHLWICAFCVHLALCSEDEPCSLLWVTTPPSPSCHLGVSITLMGHSSHKSRSEESGVAPPEARAGSVSKGLECPPHLTLLLLPSWFWRELSLVPPSCAQSISTV